MRGFVRWVGDILCEKLQKLWVSTKIHEFYKIFYFAIKRKKSCRIHKNLLESQDYFSKLKIGAEETFLLYAPNSLLPGVILK